MKNHEFAELVNDLRDVPAVQSKRAIIVRILTGAGIKPDGHEIALPALEQQGGWISCSERMPPSKTGVLVGCWYGREWATKWATLIHGHPDASNEGWIIPGASWVPTHWHELPPQPQPDTNPQIDNDGWIEWGGGDIPIESRLRVDLKLRDGYITLGIPAERADWEHKFRDFDIIAYRVIENDGRGEEC